MRLRTTLIVLLVLVASLALACGKDETPTPGTIAIPEVESSSGTPAAVQPTEAPTTPADGQPTAYPEPESGTPSGETDVYPAPLDGAALLQERCSGPCHGVDRPTSAKKDAAGWQETVERMISHGATLNAVETKVLVDYLAATYK